jgi:hypothetical protein
MHEAVVQHLQGKEVTNAPKAPGRGYGMPKRREGGGGKRGRSGGRERGRGGASRGPRRSGHSAAAG